MKTVAQTWIALTLIFGNLDTCRAGIINGSFETGDLTGWTANPTTLVTVATSYHTHGPIFTPVDGNHFALLLTGGGTNVYTTLSQTFTVNAGDILTGYAFFQANDEMPHNDDAYVRIVENNSILFQSDVSTVGDSGNTPWTFFTYVFSTPGTYTIEAGVRNVLDNAFPSALGLDNVQLLQTTVPEPSSIALIALMIVPAGIYLRGRHRL
ncbi:MAG: PEP-CTERM sorting domain-containing protein [Gemmataceae bacterium]|nr:PEP-CTERM sorting domain-containing protein [Gemmataceae bacterium]